MTTPRPMLSNDSSDHKSSAWTTDCKITDTMATPSRRHAPMRQLVRGLSALNCMSSSSKDLFQSSSHSCDRNDGLTKTIDNGQDNLPNPMKTKEVEAEVETPALLPRTKSLQLPKPPQSLLKMEDLTLDQVFSEYDRIIAMHTSQTSLDNTEAETETEQDSNTELRVTALSSPAKSQSKSVASAAHMATSGPPMSSPKLQRPAPPPPPPRRGLSRFSSMSNLYRTSPNKAETKRSGLARQSSLRIATASPVSSPKSQRPTPPQPTPRRGLSRFSSMSNLYSSPNTVETKRPGLSRQSSVRLVGACSSKDQKHTCNSLGHQSEHSRTCKKSKQRPGLGIRQHSMRLPQMKNKSPLMPRKEKKSEKPMPPPRGLGRYCSMSNLDRGCVSRGNTLVNCNRPDTSNWLPKSKNSSDKNTDARQQQPVGEKRARPPKRTKSLEHCLSDYEAIVAPEYQQSQDGETLTGW